MAAENATEETALFREAYSRYRDRYVSTVSELCLAPFRHIETAQSVRMEWAAYHEMFKEHTQEIANELNRFSRHIEQLRCWAEILPEYEDSDQIALLMEFAEPLATCCVNYPYAIRSRFVFSIAHLCHQANRAFRTDWNEDMLPDDRKINYKIMISTLDGWHSAPNIRAYINELCNGDFEDATGGFRNKFHHRYPPRFEIGLTQMVSRIRQSDGTTSYGFGYVEPLQLDDIVPILREQHSAARACFDSYTDLIREQLSTIYKS